MYSLLYMKGHFTMQCIVGIYFFHDIAGCRNSLGLDLPDPVHCAQYRLIIFHKHSLETDPPLNHKMPVKVLRSYLMKRQMVVRHKGETSAIMSLPGSCGQGTNLGILSYLVNINSCGLPMDDIVKYVLRKCNSNDRRAFSCVPALPLPPYHITESAARLK